MTESMNRWWNQRIREWNRLIHELNQVTESFDRMM